MDTPSPTSLIDTAPMSTSLVLERHATTTEQIVQAWHDETHPDGWAVCMLQPCHAIQTADVDWQDFS